MARGPKKLGGGEIRNFPTKKECKERRLQNESLLGRKQREAMKIRRDRKMINDKTNLLNRMVSFAAKEFPNDNCLTSNIRVLFNQRFTDTLHWITPDERYKSTGLTLTAEMEHNGKITYFSWHEGARADHVLFHVNWAGHKKYRILSVKPARSSSMTNKDMLLQIRRMNKVFKAFKNESVPFIRLQMLL